MVGKRWEREDLNGKKWAKIFQAAHPCTMRLGARVCRIWSEIYAGGWCGGIVGNGLLNRGKKVVERVELYAKINWNEFGVV